MKKVLVLALALCGLCTTTQAQPVDARSSDPIRNVVVGQFPLFPPDVPAIRPGDQPVDYRTGIIARSEVFATVPFAYARPIRLTEDVIYNVWGFKFNDYKPGDYGFLADAGEPPQILCLFKTGQVTGPVCHDRVRPERGRDKYRMETVQIISPFPTRTGFEKDTVMGLWPAYEENVVLPGDFVFQVQHGSLTKDGLDVSWLYNGEVFYRRRLAPDANGEIALLMPDGKLVFTLTEKKGEARITFVASAGTQAPEPAQGDSAPSQP